MAVDALARALAAGKVPVSAYEMAVKAGYTGTEEQFAEDMGNSGTNAANAAASASAAAASAQSVSASAAQIATNTSDISELKTQLNDSVGFFEKIYFNDITYLGVTISKDSSGKYAASGTSTRVINKTLGQFTLEAGRTYKFESNQSTSTTDYYLYLLGVNGTSTWIRTGTSFECTVNSNVYIAFYCGNNITVNTTFLPTISEYPYLSTKYIDAQVRLNNKYGADSSQITISDRIYQGITFKNIIGGLTVSGTSTQAISLGLTSFDQEIGKIYHYKLNPNYNNSTSYAYFYIYGVNGGTTWIKDSEYTWTATDTSTVQIRFYCPDSTTINLLVNPVLNNNYTNAELFELVSEAKNQANNAITASVEGNTILFTGNSVTWENPGSVINYKTGLLSTTGNPNAFVSTGLFDITKYIGLVLTFEGHTKGESGIVFFDENNAYVNGVNSLGETTLPNDGYRINVQVPSNAKYCRVGAYGTYAKDLSIYINEKNLTEQLIKTFDFDNTMFKGGIRAGSSLYNAFPMIPTNFETYANVAYNTLIDYMKANGYDAVPVYIVSDSHGNAMSPFAWLNQIDKSVKCLQLGDIVNDYYNEYEIKYYNEWTKRIENIATVTGNHDVNYSTETISEYIILKNFVTSGRQMGGNKNYYFVDDGDFRVRYICLDPFDIASDGKSFSPIYEADQISWFANVLKETKYDVVILVHYPLCDQAEDRTGTTFTTGPYADNQSSIGAIINAFQNKTTVSVTVGADTITADYTDNAHSILCSFCGHTHKEGTAVQYGVRHYIAQNYQSESHWASAFVIIDRTDNELKVLKFDNTQNFTEWDLSLS